VPQVSIHRRGNKGVRFFRTRAFEFELLRVLWAIPFNGADVRETLSTVSSISEGDFDSWYEAWSGLANSVARRGSALSDSVSRGKAALRASNYMRTAEFFLAGGDPRRPGAAAFAREKFYDALEALAVDFTRSRIPYDGAVMETLFLRSPVNANDDVLVVHGGFDSTPEELYFTIGAGALERGFHVLIWEGPGQGNLLREFDRPFVADWERPAGVALDSLFEQCRPRAVIGVGISLGGHLLARSAAHMPRYHGIVLFDFFPAVGDAFAYRVPERWRELFLRMPAWLVPLVRLYARHDRELAWGIANGEWTFGAHGIRELVDRVRPFDDRGWTSQIDTHVLALVGEHEHFFDPGLAEHFAARLTSARSTRLRELRQTDGGGDLHCQVGAIQVAHEEIFDWIANTVLADGKFLDSREPTQPQREGARPAVQSASDAPVRRIR